MNRWNGAALANAAGVARATVNTWLTHKRPTRPNGNALRQLSEVSGYSVDWILFGGPLPELRDSTTPVRVLAEELQRHVVASLRAIPQVGSKIRPEFVPSGEEMLARIEDVTRDDALRRRRILIAERRKEALGWVRVRQASVLTELNGGKEFLASFRSSLEEATDEEILDGLTVAHSYGLGWKDLHPWPVVLNRIVVISAPLIEGALTPLLYWDESYRFACSIDRIDRVNWEVSPETGLTGTICYFSRHSEARPLHDALSVQVREYPERSGRYEGVFVADALKHLCRFCGEELALHVQGRGFRVRIKKVPMFRVFTLSRAG